MFAMAVTVFEFSGRRKRGAEGAKGVESGDGCFCWGRYWEGSAHPQKISVKFTLNSLILQHCVRITTV